MTQTKQTNRFALLLILYYLGASLALAMAVPLQELPYNAYMSLAQLICFVPPICFYFVRTKKPVRQTLRLHPLGLKNALLVIAFAVALLPLMGFLSLITAIFFPNPVEDIASYLLEGRYLAAVLSTALLPAILEELPNRGILLSGYQALGKRRAAFASALFFAILHMNPQQFLYTFVVGYCFCILVERTDSIYSSILAHFIINGSTVLSVFSQPAQSTAPQTVEISTQMLLLGSGLQALLSLPILLLVLYLLFRLNPPQAVALGATEEDGQQRERLLSPAFVVICILYIALGLLPYFSA